MLRSILLASRSETFGRSVLEAMACGTPCVVNDIPIMREVTAGSAILADFSDRESSTEALRRLSDAADSGGFAVRRARGELTCGS